MRKHKTLFLFLIFLLILGGCFYSLLLNINSNLIDWFDYPLVTWLILQSAEKIKDLQFTNFFDTNAFYPYKNTLFFSDSFIPQAIIVLPLTFFTTNHILIMNILFFITFILNYISTFLFWRQLFKNSFVGFIGAILTVFSPFTHLQLSHFQMLNFWPFFFGAYFLIKEDHLKSYRNTILVGIFLAVQFLAGVYLSVFFCFFVLLFYFAKLLFSPQKQKIVKHLLLVFIVFLLIDGIFIKGYLDTKAEFKVTRDVGEYIQYSAHLSDYIFPLGYKSVFWSLPVFGIWNTFNKHTVGELGTFPGITLLALSVLSIFTIFKKNKTSYFAIKLSRERLFFLGLVFLGILFSLGPRLSFNGQYAHIPAPYLLLLKLPLFEAVRALARWNFLFYIGLIYFSLDFIQTRVLLKKHKKKLFLIPILFFIALEYIPWNLKTHSESYTSADYTLLKNMCDDQKKVVLEVPITHFDTSGGVAEGLNYISKTELSSLYHECFLVNGYSGYDLPQIQKLKDEFYQFSNSGNGEDLLKLLNAHKVQILKYNKDKIKKEKEGSISATLIELTESGKLKSLSENIFLVK